MTFAAAKAYAIPWGIFKDQTIDQAAQTDRGLRWLDFMRGTLDEQGHQPFAPSVNVFRQALSVYLDDGTIAGDLAKIVRRA